MAVVDKYTDANLQSTRGLALGANAHGGDLVAIAGTFEVAAGDDDGSVYRIAAGLPANLIPYKFEIYNDAITGGTDYDLGLYLAESGVVVDADLLADGMDLSSANGRTSPENGLQTLNVDQTGKRLWELTGLGYTEKTKPDGFDIALTANTVGTAAGTISFELLFLQG